jgi:hypothetical protein
VREAVVWRGDGEQLQPVLPGGRDERGTVGELKGIAPFVEVCQRLRAAPGVDAVSALAFPVLPQAR